jgi:hypothetical protein
MNKKLKIILLLAILLGAGFVVFTFLQKAPTAPVTQSGLSSSGDALGGAIAKKDITSLAGLDDFSAALANIRSVTIDTSIFTNSVYKTLQDNPISLGTEVVGRNNPFAPVGTDLPDQTFPITQDQTQVVSANAASISTGVPIKIKKTTAVLVAQAAIDPGATATVVFAYGDTDALGAMSTPIKVKLAGPVTFALKGLKAGTTYFVKATMTIGDITTEGDIISFNTL